MGEIKERRSFPAAPASAAQARRFVESVLEGELEHFAYAATMLVSELVANAVLHTGTTIEVVVLCPERDRVRVEVHDGSAQLPVRKHYSTLSGTGRGLLLVERMASAWGSRRKDDGKVVWFELDGTATRGIDFLGVEAL